MSTIQESIGTRIRELRKAKLWTQEDLAAKCGTTQEVVSDVEQGLHTPLLTTLEKYAAALGVSISSLLPD